MAMPAVRLANANRMMTSVRLRRLGIEIVFADGRRGVVPFSELPGVGGFAGIAQLQLPNAYEVVVHTTEGKTFELPWDFARGHCDPAYRPRVGAIAARGRELLGSRIHRLRKSAKLTQGALAVAAGIGRVTLVRIENGEQSPRHETLLALANALGRAPADLLVLDQ